MQSLVASSALAGTDDTKWGSVSAFATVNGCAGWAWVSDARPAVSFLVRSTGRATSSWRTQAPPASG